MHTVMGLTRLIARFILIGVVSATTIGAVAQASAASSVRDVAPGSSREPVFHRSQSSGVEIGRVRIPAIGVDEVIRSGVAISVIDRGVAHWAGTSGPGGPGNMVLAGHRTTHTRPFRDLDRLSTGDLVFVRDGRGFDLMYRVDEVFVVDPTDIWITYDQGSPMLTMFACHPKGSNDQRIVVTAELMGEGMIG